MTGKPYLCSGFGLRILSEVPLPGAPLLESALPPELVIRYGDAALPAPTVQAGPYKAGAGALLFEKPQVARYLCNSGSILVDVFPGASEEEVADMLIATALPAALWQRGHVMLHAGAAALSAHDAAIAFAGVSGSGKSNLLRDLLGRGSSLVAEDSLCLRFSSDDKAPRVSGLPGCLHLRTAGCALEAPRTVLPVPLAEHKNSAQLAAIVVLETGDSAPPMRLSGTQAVQALLAQQHRSKVPELLGILPSALKQIAAVAVSTPVYLWKRQSVSAVLKDSEFAWLEALKPA